MLDPDLVTLGQVMVMEQAVAREQEVQEEEEGQEEAAVNKWPLFAQYLLLAVCLIGVGTYLTSLTLRGGIRPVRAAWRALPTRAARVRVVVGLALGALLAVPGLVVMWYIAIKLKEVLRP